MKILIALESKLGSVFNIMAFIRTVICIILIIGAMSCGTIEYAYSEASWVAHTIHFQENMDMPNCEWCLEYNKVLD